MLFTHDLEAKILQDKIEHQAYADDEIIRILITWSKSYLLATFNNYNDSLGHPITKVHTKLMAIFFLLLFLLNIS
jgi:hypothetical protein